MNKLIEGCLEATRNQKSAVAGATIVENTTMEHIITGFLGGDILSTLLADRSYDRDETRFSDATRFPALKHRKGS